MEQKDLELVQRHFSAMPGRVEEARKRLGRPLTLTEKILFSHLAVWPAESLERGKTHLSLKPDRIAMQDATAQMALLQFMVTGRDTVSVPTTVHCDHLVQAKVGSQKDLLRALDENHEVYEFLQSASQRYGIGFWKAGSGIIHQVVLEQYAFPGGMMIGTDSHTPNAGGLGMIAVGVGGADAVDVMAGLPWSVLNPRLVGVRLTGSLKGWASPKDVILKVAGALTVKGGTGKIVEYFGPGTATISCTGKGTITNMGAELGATTSIFPYDAKMGAYLKETERSAVAELADKHAAFLAADEEVQKDPARYFDEVLEIDLSKLEPQWVGPHTPDLLRSVSEMRSAVKEKGYPDDIRYALIGSCTNSSYEDISRAASVAKQARERGLKTKIPLLVTPGSDQIYKTIERDGFLKIFEDVGATVLANACGPCIGQWSRDDIKPGEQNTIITSFNRNFKKRNDGNSETMAFIGSPELVTAMAFYGKLSANPVLDKLLDAGGSEFTLNEPSGSELPPNGFVFSREGFVEPGNLEQRKQVQVAISPSSDRLSFIEPFPAWDGKDFIDLPVLLKALGKCTTDHISQAGPWLKYRGHLANISNNTYLGAVNAYTNEPGKGVNVITGERGLPFPEIAKQYKRAGVSWITIADENYGEGSSREHAAMSPRYLGCKAVIAKSFARIAETNLKKQGILPLTFADPSTYDLIGELDRISVVGLSSLAPGCELQMIVKTPEGGETKAVLKHSLNQEQIEWFKAGSALNMLRPAS
ncbi:MAG: aconitate hydratase [Deltaproteobacteria bacterium]|nr:aconitate hydratase [Deltaproteobacteria bacterium]